MNTRQMIAEWLKEGTFEKGVELLEKLDPKNQFLPVLKQKGATEYNRGKLRLQLRELRGKRSIPFSPSQEAREGKVSLVLPRAVVPVGAKLQHEKLYPEPIAEAIKERGKTVNARNRLSNQLGNLRSNQEREMAVAEIHRLQSEIEGLSDYIGHWERTGNVGQRRRKLTEGELKDLERKIKLAITRRSNAKQQVWRWKQNTKANDLVRQGKIQEHEQKWALEEALIKKWRESLKSGYLYE